MPQTPLPILVPPNQAIEAGPDLPPDFYHLLTGPVSLGVCAFPFGFRNWKGLHARGFRHVFCLSSENPRYSPSPLEFAVACELDDLSWRKLPTNPEQEAEHIVFIAEILAETLLRGEAALIHCAAGRGRSGCLAAVALRMLGIPAKTIIKHLNTLHRLRSGNKWPESPWQSELVSRNF